MMSGHGFEHIGAASFSSSTKGCVGMLRGLLPVPCETVFCTSPLPARIGISESQRIVSGMSILVPSTVYPVPLKAQTASPALFDDSWPNRYAY